MDSLPPNDPNRRNVGIQNNDNTSGKRGTNKVKEIPYDGRSSNGRNQSRGRNNDEPMDVLGDLQDAPVVIAMFLVTVATWFLRDRCVC